MATQKIDQQKTTPPFHQAKMLMNLLESAPVAIATVSDSGKILFANTKLTEMFGYAKNELQGALIEQLIPQRFWNAHVEHRSGFMKQPAMRTMGSGLDLVGIRKDGTEFPIEVGLSPVQFREQTIVMSLVTDITYRKKIEETLEKRVIARTHEIEQRRRVAEDVRHILTVLNSNQTLEKTLEYVVTRASLLMDAEACVLYRFQPETGRAEIFAHHKFLIDTEINTGKNVDIDLLIGRTLENKTVLSKSTLTISNLTHHPSHHKLLLDRGYQALLAVQILIKDEVYGGLTWYFTKSTDFSAETIQIAMTLSDQAALAIENDRLRMQVSENAVLAERNRIARDLHDSVSQTLFSANLIAEVLPRLWEKDPAQGKKSAGELWELTRGALAEMRTLLFELRPSTLQKIPLGDLLQQLHDAMIARARLAVTLHIEGHREGHREGHKEGHSAISVEVKTALFYIAQEALNNIAKHARAETVTIDLQHESGAIQLSIVDDGCGFDPTEVPPDHLGLRIMNERTAKFDGTLTIESAPQQGTKVLVRWNG